MALRDQVLDPPTEREPVDEWPSRATGGLSQGHPAPSPGRRLDVRDLLVRVEAASNRMFDYYAHNRHLEDELQRLRDSHSQLGAQLDEAQGHAARFEADLGDATVEIERLRGLLSSAYGHLEDREREVTIAQENLDILQLAIERAFVDPALGERAGADADARVVAS